MAILLWPCWGLPQGGSCPRVTSIIRGELAHVPEAVRVCDVGHFLPCWRCQSQFSADFIETVSHEEGLTGIFPIMHFVAIRRKLVQAEPWLPKAVFDAYVEARNQDYQEMKKIRWAYSSLPWFGQEFDATRQLMGENFYTYGIKQNQKTLEAICRYLFQQGLATRKMSVQELFVESTHDLADA